MNAPSPNTPIRVTHADPFAIPPVPLVAAFRATYPQPRHRFPWSTAAAMALCVACLAVFVATLHASPRGGVVVVAGEVGR